MKSKKIFLWLPVILWMAVIFFFSAQNADESTKTSGFAAEIFEFLINTFFGSRSDAFKSTLLDNCHFIVRKLAHFTEYAVLGVLSSIAVTGYRRVFRIGVPAALCLLYAASDEFHQYFVPGRSCQIRDVIIDFSGSLSGILIFTLCLFLAGRRKQRKNTG